jgi:RNA-binding protein YhbY
MEQLGTGARIGKEGLKQGVIDEIRKQLRVKGIVKVKLLRAFILSNPDKKKKELFREIAALTGGEIVSAVGFVLVLKRP